MANLLRRLLGRPFFAETPTSPPDMFDALVVEMKLAAGEDLAALDVVRRFLSTVRADCTMNGPLPGAVWDKSRVGVVDVPFSWNRRKIVDFRDPYVDGVHMPFRFIAVSLGAPCTSFWRGLALLEISSYALDCAEAEAEVARCDVEDRPLVRAYKRTTAVARSLYLVAGLLSARDGDAMTNALRRFDRARVSDAEIMAEYLAVRRDDPPAGEGEERLRKEYLGAALSLRRLGGDRALFFERVIGFP